MIKTIYQCPDQSPGYLLWRVSTSWRRSIEEALKPIGLTHPQFVILACTGWLTRTGNKVTQAEIGKQAGLDPNTTSQILRGLQKKGLIKRTSKQDDRSKNPSLTESGAKLLAKAMPIVEQKDQDFFAGVDVIMPLRGLLNASLNSRTEGAKDA